MSFEAKDFYELALWLATTKKDEASFRSAISRAYYAAHLLAVEKAQSRKRFAPKGTGDDHMGVIRALNLGKTNTIATRLVKLLARRTHADYHLKTSDDIQEVCDYCKELRRISASHVGVDQSFWEQAKADTEKILNLLQTL